MNSFIVVLSLAAVALAAPQHVQHHASLVHSAHLGAHALHDSKVATEGVVTTLSGRADVHPLPESRSAWTGTAGAAGLVGLDARLAPAGRAAWTHDAHLNGEAHSADHILEQRYEMEAPGGYLYSYKTSNGIEAQERAALKSEDAEEVQGAYSWVAPNGEKFAVEYVADETGYHARGAHIPEIPVAIARSLEWNAAHPEEDGSAGMWQGAERIQSGRAAWVSKDSANVPHWEAAAKIESSRAVSASGRSAWNPALTGLTGTGATQITKITETKPAFTTYTASGLAPAGRSAWASDAALTTGYTGTGLTGATQITKITETKAAFPTYTASGLEHAAL